ncbi:MAG TPA: HD domain-containing phosphohydrolase [Sporichthyaceae bacterium]|jgi:HD-GYP domain-containing protein (c-di-GMP phosphodiesterase class II)|nr:HD domain-containing phosphohydrolase [Sporichthyaceae bacterium]
MGFGSVPATRRPAVGEGAGSVAALLAAVAVKDPYTAGHAHRVAVGAELIGRGLGLPPERCAQLRLTGLLHDIGKLAVSTPVLRKSEELTAADVAELHDHPARGVDLLADLEVPAEVLAGVLHHHERMDGAGYPDRLAAGAIPEFARAVAVADAYDAMTTRRPYGRVRTPVEALDELWSAAGTQFDPVMVAAFADALRQLLPAPSEGDFIAQVGSPPGNRQRFFATTR